MSLKITPLPQAATGLGAVKKSFEVALGQLGVAGTWQLFTTVNQKGGFDCPSCAWPDPANRHFVEFCENGAKAFSDEGTRTHIGRDFFGQWPVAQLETQTDHWLNAQGRLIEPMVLRPGATHYNPIGWQEAFDLIAAELKALASPDEAIFYTSGRASNEAAFLYQLFVRRFGTNNLPDCSNMCHESSGAALTRTIGIGKSTVTLDDLENAGCVLVIGQNPGTNHPRMLSSLEIAARRGAKIVSINPLKEVGLVRFRHPQHLSGLVGGGTALASQHVGVRINGDLPLFQAIARILLEENRGIDRAFITQHTEGFESYAAHILAQDLAELVEQCGVPEAEIRELANTMAAADGVVCCWAMGLTQHRNAVETICELVNLMLLGGNVGKPKAGFFCVRGHSNVQGDRTMGINERPSALFLDRLGAEFGFEPPREHGHDTVAAIQAMHAGEGKVFFALGGNFLSATPDTDYTAEALRRCSLTVQVSTKLNRSHLVTGRTALILPCLGRTERDPAGFVTTENALSIIQTSQGVRPAASEDLLSETAIVHRLGQACGIDLPAGYDQIRDHIARVVPGCEDFNARVRQPGGFQFDIPPGRRIFPTSSGKARFTVNPLRPLTLAPGEYLMMTIRSHDQFNTTVYGLDDRYRGIYQERRIVLMHPDDIAAAGYAPGDRVDLHNAHRLAPDFQLVSYEIPRGSIATYFPEANVLIPVDAYADISRTPVSKSVPVTLTRHAG